MKNFIKNSIVETLTRGGDLIGMNKKERLVLCFHSIGNGGNKYTVSLKRFEYIIRALSKRYTFVSLDVLLSSKSERNLASITFDDGYKNVYLAADFLNSYKIPATAFVLAKPQDADLYNLSTNQNLMTTSEVKSLEKLGFEIGCHSATHEDFKKLTKELAIYEIKNAKKLLEAKIGHNVKYFAYPKGVWTRETADIVRQAGFVAGFTTKPSLITRKNKKYAFPRYVIEKENIYGPLPYSFSKSVQVFRNLKKYEN